MSDQLTVLVTGADKGIGRAICDKLAAAGRPTTIVLTARDEANGRAARDAVAAAGGDNAARVLFMPLDVTDTDRIPLLAAELDDACGGLDVLINNAGIAWWDATFDGEVVRQTLGTNFFGLRNVTRGLLPLLRPGGRVVNVASQMGHIAEHYSPALQARFRDPGLSEDDAVALMDEFAAAVDRGSYAEDGWRENAYGVSKAGVIALTRAWARAWGDDPRGLTVNACCPGWCRTRMGGDNATLSAEEGADTPVWLAVEYDGGVSGGFFHERKPLDW